MVKSNNRKLSVCNGRGVRRNRHDNYLDTRYIHNVTNIWHTKNHDAHHILVDDFNTGQKTLGYLFATEEPLSEEMLIGNKLKRSKSYVRKGKRNNQKTHRKPSSYV